MPNNDERSCTNEVRHALVAIAELLSTPSLQNSLMEPDAAGQAKAMNELGLPPEVRPAVLRILTTALQDVQPASSNGRARTFDEEREEWRRIQLRPFRHIQSAYRISMIMSTSLFTCGLVLFLLATVRAIAKGEADSSTLLIAGLGAADFIALIYTRPLKDVGNNLVATQRATMIASSYLGGLALVARNDAEALERLESLLRSTIELTRQSPTGPG